MAAASYTTDLTTLNAADNVTNWVEMTGYTQTGTPVLEGDYFIQNTGCISATLTKTGLGSVAYNNGAGVTPGTTGAFLVWQYFAAPNAVNTEANGGIRLIVGSGLGDFNAWKLSGSDTYTYGGWQCLAVDPTQTADYTSGTPSGTYQYVGVGIDCTNAVSKGNPFGVDAIRYGRCEMRINGGDLTNGYATFAGYTTQNDSTANRWGLFQAIEGGYKWQGLMTLGYTSAVDFRDSNRVIVVANTKKVASGFNKIEIRQASSRVDWTGISFAALGTQSRGNFEVIDDADVNFDGCSFTDMGTFIFKSASTILNTTFRRTDLITTNGAVFTGCLFTNSRVASTMTLTGSNLANVTASQFISDGSNHAVEITGSTGSFTLSSLTFTGYDAGSAGSPVSTTSTGNEAVYVNIASGTVTLNISGGTTPSVRSAGATVNVVSSVTVSLTGLKNPSEVRVFTAGTTTEVSGTGAESVVSGTHNFSVGSGVAVDISILSLGYQNLRILNYSTTVSASVPVSQVLDRQYANT